MFWAIFSTAYMLGCTILPFVVKNCPHKVIYFVSFGIIGVANMFMGTSKIFGLTENLTYIMIGLFVMGASIVPAYIFCLPQVYLDTQIKYRLVEKVDEELDGYISD